MSKVVRDVVGAGEATSVHGHTSVHVPTRMLKLQISSCPSQDVSQHTSATQLPDIQSAGLVHGAPSCAGVLVGVTVGLSVGVLVGVSLGVAVGVAVGVLVTVNVGVGEQFIAPGHTQKRRARTALTTDVAQSAPALVQDTDEDKEVSLTAPSAPPQTKKAEHGWGMPKAVLTASQFGNGAEFPSTGRPKSWLASAQVEELFEQTVVQDSPSAPRQTHWVCGDELGNTTFMHCAPAVTAKPPTADNNNASETANRPCCVMAPPPLPRSRKRNKAECAS